jgi:hypothetical protein
MPDQIREQVAEKVLARAVAAKWDDLNANERSRLYRVWSEDPEIGGVIARFIPRDGVRVWIKDGPMKEYTRARRGLGPFAGSIPVTTESEERITGRVLGPGWALKPGTIGVKPAKFVATNTDGDETLILWGSSKDLKHLVWAWLNLPRHMYGIIVVVSSQRQPVTSDERDYIESIGAKLNTDIRVVS